MRAGRWLPPAGLIALLLVAWQLYADHDGLGLSVLPGPTRILAQGWEQREALWENTLPTLRATLLGFSLSLVVAFATRLWWLLRYFGFDDVSVLDQPSRQNPREPQQPGQASARRERVLPAPGRTRRRLAYCGGGISATIVVFALSLPGRDDVRLYDGSLAEWSADPSLPLALG